MTRIKEEIEKKQYVLNAHSIEEYNTNHFEQEDWAYVGTNGYRTLIKLYNFDEDSKALHPVKLTRERLEEAGVKEDKYKENTLGYYDELTNNIVKILFDSKNNIEEIKINRYYYVTGDFKYLHHVQHVLRRNNIYIKINP